MLGETIEQPCTYVLAHTEYGGSDAGTELYIIEQYHDYQMVDGKCVVT
jgi:hypothetical protein